eukprot:3830833-Prymnesium_polylepis.1
MATVSERISAGSAQHYAPIRYRTVDVSSVCVCQSLVGRVNGARVCYSQRLVHVTLTVSLRLPPLLARSTGLASDAHNKHERTSWSQSAKGVQ